MIKRLIVKGFRKLQEFEWSPQDGINVLVGDNSAGKSTILDAIELVTSCRLHGKPARADLSPYWFNLQNVDKFFDTVDQSDQSSISIPEILIEAYFDDSVSGDIRGVNNSLLEDCPGLQLKIEVDSNLRPELLALCKSEENRSRSIPTDYYKLEWKTFKGESILKTPKAVSCSRIDALPRTSLRAIDSYAKSAIDEALSDDQIRNVSNKYRELRHEVDEAILSEMGVGAALPPQLNSMGFRMDQSPRSDWRNSVVIDFDSIPLPYAGKGNEIATRAHIAMQKSAGKKLLLVEEPESHLSHTSLFELLDLLENSLDGRQMFVSTHSPFVLNRLGLNKLALVADGNNPVAITSLSDDTVRYFQKLSGYDTLRIVLARKLVLVEGPSDEMIFKWAYKKRCGHYPEFDAIDVMEYGTRGKRALELCCALNRGKVAVLRDNDGQPPSHWIKDVEEYLDEECRRMFIGQPELGNTLEPQITCANRSNISCLAKLVGSDASDEESLAEYMKSHKTEWALKLLLDDDCENLLAAPAYIEDAISYIAEDPSKDSM